MVRKALNYSPSHIVQITDFFYNFSMETTEEKEKKLNFHKILDSFCPNEKHRNKLLMFSSCE